MKKKKSVYKKFAKNNKVLLAALGGAAAGITLATLLGTDKAKEMLNSVEGNISNFSSKLTRERATPELSH